MATAESLDAWSSRFSAGTPRERIGQLLPLVEALRPQWERAWQQTHEQWRRAGAPSDLEAAAADAAMVLRAIEALGRWTASDDARDAVQRSHAEFYPRSMEIAGDIHQVVHWGQPYCWYLCGFVATSLAVVAGEDAQAAEDDLLGIVAAFVDSLPVEPELASSVATLIVTP